MLSLCGLSEEEQHSYSCLHAEKLDTDNYLQIGSYVPIFTSPDGKKKVHAESYIIRFIQQRQVLFMTWREKKNHSTLRSGSTLEKNVDAGTKTVQHELSPIISTIRFLI